MTPPFRRMPYAEAIAKYGSDKPDLRCGIEIADLSEAFRESEFRVFKQIVAEGGVIRGIRGAGRQQVHAEPDRRARRSGQADGIQRPDLGAAGRAAAQLGRRRSSEGSLRTALGGVGRDGRMTCC